MFQVAQQQSRSFSAAVKQSLLIYFRWPPRMGNLLFSTLMLACQTFFSQLTRSSIWSQTGQNSQLHKQRDLSFPVTLARLNTILVARVPVNRVSTVKVKLKHLFSFIVILIKKSIHPTNLKYFFSISLSGYITNKCSS